MSININIWESGNKLSVSLDMIVVCAQTMIGGGRMSHLNIVLNEWFGMRLCLTDEVHFWGPINEFVFTNDFYEIGKTCSF